MKLTRSRLHNILVNYIDDPDMLEEAMKDIFFIIDMKEIKVKEFSNSSREYHLATHLYWWIKSNRELLRLKPMAEPNMQQWAKQIDLMIRVDGIDQNEIEDVITWCQQDAFWKTNILSTQKLRKHYMKLAFMMASSKNHNNKPGIRTIKYEPINSNITR